MCNACTPITVPGTEEPTAAEQFMGRMVQTLNDAGLALMLSIGHRTGLFDTMGELGWTTSEELARESGLEERYVREWLGAMATGRVVDIDGSGDIDRYRLPAAHAEALGRAGESMGTLFQWISVLGEVETKVVQAFREGGGVPYQAFSRFHQVMAEESGLTVVAGLFEHILPLVPGVADELETGIDVMDVGCGSGRALCELAARFPRSRFVGYDLCEPAIESARETAKARGLKNIRFEARDATTLGHEAAFDLITGFDVIHDQRDPAAVLRGMHRALKPGGTLLIQDIRADSRVANNIDHPLCPLLYTISTMHCMTVSLAQGGAGLGTAWGEQLAMKMFADAGFEEAVAHQLEHDIQNNWYVMTRPIVEASRDAA